MVCVSCNDATAYAKCLIGQTGRRFRLPTEAEWEYAARAGTRTARYWGDDANVYDRVSKQENEFSWAHHVCGDSAGQTSPVGRYRPNALGLHDMLGNVWEWTCWAYDKDYGGGERRCASSGAARTAPRCILE